MSRKCLGVLAVAVVAPLLAFAPPWQAGGKPPVKRWVVLADVGSKWDATKSPQEQPGFAEHHTYMEKLATDGALLLGGPFFESHESQKFTGALFVLQAESADAAKKLLASDPFVKDERMKITSVRAFLAGIGAWIPASEKPAAPAGKKN